MPLLFKHTNPLRAVWKIDETPDDLKALLGTNSLYAHIPDHIYTNKRKQEWLAARLLVKELCDGEEPEVQYLPSGQPVFKELHLHISISHTKGYAAVLLQEEPYAGIDIEYRGDRIRKIRRRFMSEEEESNLDLMHECDHLLIHWCAKEALFKMIGQIGVDFKRHLHISPFPYAESGSFEAFESRTNEGMRFRLSYQVFPDFVMVWSQPY